MNLVIVIFPLQETRSDLPILKWKCNDQREVAGLPENTIGARSHEIDRKSIDPAKTRSRNIMHIGAPSDPSPQPIQLQPFPRLRRWSFDRNRRFLLYHYLEFTASG